MSRDIRELELWIREHPWQTKFLTLGGAILIFELAMVLRYTLEALARWIGGA